MTLSPVCSARCLCCCCAQDDVLSLDSTPPDAAAKSLGGTGEEINEDEDSSGDENGQGTALHCTATARSARLKRVVSSRVFLRCALRLLVCRVCFHHRSLLPPPCAALCRTQLTWTHVFDLSAAVFQITATTVRRMVTASPLAPCSTQLQRSRTPVQLVAPRFSVRKMLR